MENEAVLEAVEVVSLTDEAIQEELGILAGRRAAQRFEEGLGGYYIEDSN